MVNFQRFLLYARVSKEEEGTDVPATVRQLDALKQYCKSKGWEPTRCYEDIGVSGATPLQSREQGKRLWSDLLDDATVVLAYRQDRLFRDLGDAINTAKDFGLRGIALHLVTESYDIATPVGFLTFGIMACVGYFDLLMIRQRTRDKMQHKKAAGEQVSHLPPYGRRWQDSGKVSKKGKAIMVNVLDQSEQENLKLMKKLRWAGKTYPQIAAHLNSAGVASRSGAEWVPHMVRKILAKEPKKPRPAKAAAGEPKCRECGCTENDCRQCIEKTGSPCTWVEEDLCSACADAEDAQILTAKADNDQAHDDDRQLKGL